MKTWAPRGKGVTAPSFLSKKRFHMFGALSEGRFVCKFYEKADKHSMIKFLRTLHETYGKIVVFTDNASIHKSHDVKKFVKECKGDIILKYYPSYTPQLNKAENQWLNLRRFTANRVFDSLNDCKKFIRKGLNGGKIKIVEMSDYLT